MYCPPSWRQTASNNTGGQVHDHRIPTDWPQRNGERFKGMHVGANINRS